MKRSTKHLRIPILLLSAACFLSGLTGCAHQPAVIPDSREVIDLSKGSESRPGWYGISGGYLRQIFQDLEKCGSSK